MQYRPPEAPRYRVFGRPQRFNLRKWLRRPEFAGISTAVMAVATLGIFVANVAFVIFSSLQWIAIRDQSVQINSQAVQTEQRFQVEQRPWVGVRFDFQPKYLNDKHLLVVAIRLQNVGKTPAHDVVTSGAPLIPMFSRDPDEAIDEYMSSRPARPDSVSKRYILLPGESTGELSTRLVAPAIWSLIKGGRMTLAYPLRLWYTDEFNQLYSVDYCGIYSINFNGGWAACDRHNEERPTQQLLPP